MRIPEGKVKEKGEEEIFETIMTENISQINVRHQTTDPGSSENTKQDKCHKKSTPRHIIFKLQKIKDKEKLLKGARGKKYLSYRGTKLRITFDFCSETMQARREWSDIFKMLRKKKKKTHQLRILYPVKLSFQSEEKIDFLRQTKIEGISFQ